MSKLAHTIRTRLSSPPEYKLAPLKYFEVTENFESIIHPDRLTIYTVGCKFESRIVFPTDRVDHNGVNRVKRAIIEEVFGEFRPKIHELTITIYNRDFEKALVLLTEIEEQMFRDGL